MHQGDPTKIQGELVNSKHETFRVFTEAARNTYNALLAATPSQNLSKEACMAITWGIVRITQNNEESMQNWIGPH